MDIFLIRLLQFMLAIGLLVLLHEGGHFFFAKLFGVRVESSICSSTPASGSGTVAYSSSNPRTATRNTVWVGCLSVVTVRLPV